MKILVLNSGSSSLKYQLFDMESRVALATGMAERIGDEGSRVVHRQREGVGRPVEVPTGNIPDHAAAIDRISVVTGHVASWLTLLMVVVTFLIVVGFAFLVHFLMLFPGRRA